MGYSVKWVEENLGVTLNMLRYYEEKELLSKEESRKENKYTGRSGSGSGMGIEFCKRRAGSGSMVGGIDHAADTGNDRRQHPGAQREPDR